MFSCCQGSIIVSFLLFYLCMCFLCLLMNEFSGWSCWLGHIHNQSINLLGLLFSYLIVIFFNCHYSWRLFIFSNVLIHVPWVPRSSGILYLQSTIPIWHLTLIFGSIPCGCATYSFHLYLKIMIWVGVLVEKTWFSVKAKTLWILMINVSPVKTLLLFVIKLI